MAPTFAGGVAGRAPTASAQKSGFRGLDALHLAAAEAGGAELLITTDDRMIRRGARARAILHVRVVPPAEALLVLREEPTE